MPVRSDCLLHDVRAYTAGVAQDLVTVPAGELWLVKDVACRNTGGVAGGLRLSSVRSGSAAAFFEQTAPATSTLVDSGRFVVLEAGDVLRVTFGQTATVSVLLGGARLVV